MNMSQAELTAQTLALIKAAMQNPQDALSKAYVSPTSAIDGIASYDLEAPAKMLFPVLTPLRNMTPRVGAAGGIQANWRAITAINTAVISLGISEGNRGGVTTTSYQNYTAVYKEMGLEDSVTFKADLAAEGFQDLKALAVSNLLKATMIGEEFLILGGNTSLPLGTCSTPTLTQANSGGTMANNTAYGVGCVQMTLDGYRRAKLAGGVVQTYVRTNADGSTDTINGGIGQPSAQANITTANDTTNFHTVSATVTANQGTVAFAWFWNVAASNLTLGAITTINSVLITTGVGTGTTTSPGTANFGALTAADKSTDTLVIDGLLTFASNASLNSTQVVQATGTPGTGTPLTGDGVGGIVEIDAVLKSLWDNYRLSPDTIWVNSQEQKNITTKILIGGSNAAQRFVFNADQAKVGGGIMVRSYMNKYSMDGAIEIPIKLHPNMPAGTILFTTSQLPYPMNNVTNVFQMKLRRDYYQVEWPVTTRKYPYGVYFDGVLQHYFPPSLAVLTNIGNG